MSSQTSKKHHYIPAFYLRRWCNADGKLFEFSRPYKEVKTKLVSPEFTGFQERLYELKDFDEGLAQQIEDKFFKGIDTLASRALDLIDQFGNEAVWSDELRSAWTRFILSLMLRSPEDIAALRAYWPDDFAKTDEESEARYANSRAASDPETFSKFLKNLPAMLVEKHQFEVYLTLIDNPNIGEKINGMHWHIQEIPDTFFSFLTSDRPIIKTNNLISPGGHIALPVGPTKLFVASHDLEWIHRLKSVKTDWIVKACNLVVVASAVKFVYASDNSQMKFVAKRFGTKPQQGILERVFLDRKN